MFVTPMISALPSDYYGGPKHHSTSQKHASSRYSDVSSNASSLHRRSSTNSNGSASRWSTSSASSIETTSRSKHRKSLPSGPFHLPRALQPFHKKALQSQPPQQQQPSPRSQPSLPARPPRPEERTQCRSDPKPLSGDLTTQWQCSDLVVRCRDEIYHVDRAIMCYHSRWFARICAIIKKPQASKSVIDLSADDPDAVAAMMQYCYQLDYTDQTAECSSTVDEAADLGPHVDVYMLAERYGISGLKQLALEKFQDLAAVMLKVSGNEEHFLQAIRAMYAPSRRTNADDLKRAAIKTCADHVEGFLIGSHTNMAVVFELMDGLSEFRADLFKEMGSRRK